MPASFDTVVNGTLVETFVAVRFAFGILAPVGSRTSPPTCAWNVCACAEIAIDRSVTKTLKTFMVNYHTSHAPQQLRCRNGMRSPERACSTLRVSRRFLAGFPSGCWTAYRWRSSMMKFRIHAPRGRFGGLCGATGTQGLAARH